MSIVIFIPRDGDMEVVYTEEIDLRSLGEVVKISRASHVEPTTEGLWTADMSPSGGPVLGPFQLRSEALEAEQIWLEQNYF